MPKVFVDGKGFGLNGKRQVTAVVRSGSDLGYEALCPELDVTAHGSTADEARSALAAAVRECLCELDAGELRFRLSREVIIAHLEVDSERPESARPGMEPNQSG